MTDKLMLLDKQNISLKVQQIRRHGPLVIGCTLLPEPQPVEERCIPRQDAKGNTAWKLGAGQRLLPRRDPQV